MSDTKIKLAAGTHVGLVRQNNEDNFVVNGDLSKSEWIVPNNAEMISLNKYGCLLVVADGMGGTNAGEVASAIAIDTIQNVFTEENLKNVIPEDYDVSEDKIMDFLRGSIKEADLNIVKKSKEDSSTQGMGTTIVIAWILDKKAYIAWCGDSRCYVFNKEFGFSRLSKDHSYVQELVDKGELDPENAIDHPCSNVITRCLGDYKNRAKPDCRSYDLNDGDRILLCSDGLCGLCNDEKIMDVLEENEDCNECKNKLIELALSEGGYDNITIAICSCSLPKGDVVNVQNALNNTAPIAATVKINKFFFLFVVLLCIIAISFFCNECVGGGN